MGGDAMSVKVDWDPAGEVAWATMDAPPGNVLDADMMTALDSALEEVSVARPCALVLRGAGGRFSYGASVEEHLPGRVAGMLFQFTELLRRLVDFPALTVAAVEGPCLGGGLELALGCDRIVAAPDARLGLPEIKLGVFPPMGLALLPLRVGDGSLADLAATGRMATGEEASRMGLVDEVAGDVAAATAAWLEGGPLGHSKASLRILIPRLRRRRREALDRDLPSLNRLYVREFERLDDAEEGLRAFMEKRAPAWTHEDASV